MRIEFTRNIYTWNYLKPQKKSHKVPINNSNKQSRFLTKIKQLNDLAKANKHNTQLIHSKDKLRMDLN